MWYWRHVGYIGEWSWLYNYSSKNTIILFYIITILNIFQPMFFLFAVILNNWFCPNNNFRSLFCNNKIFRLPSPLVFISWPYLIITFLVCNRSYFSFNVLCLFLWITMIIDTLHASYWFTLVWTISTFRQIQIM